MGVWSFADTGALRAGTPNRYERAIALRPQGPNADFHVRQFGFYAQDQFTARPGLTITAGLRADNPSIDKPTVNPTPASSVLDTNTGGFPRGHHLWSPPPG